MCSNKEFTDGATIYDTALEDTLDQESAYLSCTVNMRKDPADILSGILKDLHLSDWEIKAAELEILKHPDGSKIILGAGAFGQVELAKRLLLWRCRQRIVAACTVGQKVASAMCSRGASAAICNPQEQSQQHLVQLGI